MTKGKELIKVSNLSVKYLKGKEYSLRNVNLSVGEGELIAVLGPLGSGKTTLIRSLSGIIPHIIPARVEGEIYVVDKNVLQTTPAELIASGAIGVIIDEPSKQIFNLTVEDDVLFGLLNVGIEWNEAIKRAKDILTLLKLDKLAQRHPKELSGGQQQRLAVAGVLALRPPVILLDEPIAMLDPIGKLEVLSMIRTLNEELGITCIITESGADVDEILSLASRAIVLSQGQVVFDGDVTDLLEKGYLTELGIGEPQLSTAFKALRSKLGEESFRISRSPKDAALIIKKLINEGRINFITYGHENSRTLTPLSKDVRLPVLKAFDIEFVYPNGVKALNGVSLQLFKGEIVSLIGQNGSGKSTLALVLSGAMPPSKGKIMIEGRDIKRIPRHELIQLVNYVFQNPDNQLFEEKVYDEVAFALRMLNLPESEVEKRVYETLSLLEIPDLAHTYIADLSKYQKTLVAIASVLVLKPKILFIDEPTNGLDYALGEKLLTKLSKLKHEGFTFVLITHNMRVAYKYSDRVILMKDGVILMEGPPREFFKNVNFLESNYIRPPHLAVMSNLLVNEGYLGRVFVEIDEFVESIRVKGVSQNA
ncbi:ABC transporter ATP-binding protein [Infirmifilum sp.]|uniref:ABC transporter ATP-binding protein n=1 Tax=Infirmifilum sp. TaxID=2856575 RepID=UPI003D0E2A2E